MSSTTPDCTQISPDAREKTCLPCDIPAFCRNNYYRGKLLTERDFTDEQRYAVDKLRLHEQRLHGWGVVCGLLLKPHPYCPDKRVVVANGFAVDTCGRDIRVLADDYLALPLPPPKSAAARRPERGPEEMHDPAGDDCGCDDEPKPVDLYVCIRYAECETEFAPAPFDDCSCSTSAQRPNRVCETYKLEMYEQQPECWDQARHGDCDIDDCLKYYREALERCTEGGHCPCIPLAFIRSYVPGTALREDQIDNWGPRRQLASTETLDRIVRCILARLPTQELTRIEDTNWEHNRRMLCREFMEEYVGTPERPRGFRVEFSHPVRSGHIEPRSFQALVVFNPENESEPRHMQVAPARVEREDDETNWARLRIDPAYARRHLEGKDFDLFLTLRCDVIHDHHGHSVDGNFLGHLPTGDNIQGGTFESWVRVRMRARND